MGYQEITQAIKAKLEERPSKTFRMGNDGSVAKGNYKDVKMAATAYGEKVVITFGTDDGDKFLYLNPISFATRELLDQFQSQEVKEGDLIEITRKGNMKDTRWILRTFKPGHESDDLETVFKE